MPENRPEEGLKVKVLNNTTPEIGIDTEKTFAENIIGAAQVGALDISSIDALSNSAQSREQFYEIIDSMAQDDVIAAVLETYAEDTTQTNDKGQIAWVEADDAKILEYTSWLLETLNVDKHIYQWAHCLITYGDVYLRLFRRSDVEEDKLFKNNQHNKTLNEKLGKKEPQQEEGQPLTEDVKLRLYASNDKYIPYVKMVDNPGEMFDLQKFGKTHGYIKAPTRVIKQESDALYNYLTKYKMKQSDVEIFDAMSFVHGCLESTNQRQPETVDIYLDDYKQRRADAEGIELEDAEHESVDSMTTSYSIKRGQSLLYNSFRIWRELNLLEMSALLNRLTMSSVIRVLNIDIGDMSRNQIEAYLNRLKEKIEQKTALVAEMGSTEYTNPAPIINTIYIPTHEGKGAITATTLGGDFDPKSLVDIEYFRDKLFGSLKVPKQYFGFTEDGAGFNGGTSLSIYSARFGKTIKNVQNVLCQMLTDLINLFLIDRGLDNYVNRFRVRMQPPVTQDEKDKREATDNRIRYVGDLMSQMTDVEDKVVRLKIYKALIESSVNDSEAMSYLQQYIDKLEEEQNPKKEEDENAGPRGGNIEITNNISGGSSSSSEEEMPDIFTNNAEESAPEESLPSLAEVSTEEAGGAEEAPLESFNDNEGKEIINEDSDEKLPSPEELEGFPEE